MFDDIIKCTRCDASVVALHGEPTLCTNCFSEVIAWGATKYVGCPLSPERLKHSSIQEILLCDEGLELYLARIKRQSEDVALEKRREYMDYHMAIARKSDAERQERKLKYIIRFETPKCTMPSHNCSIARDKNDDVQESRFASISKWWKDV